MFDQPVGWLGLGFCATFCTRGDCSNIVGGLGKLGVVTVQCFHMGLG